MFIDYVRIFIKSGDGGNGSLSFRREKFIAFGGPDGGDGGRGGDVIFKVSPHKSTLVDFRFIKHYKAVRGEDGHGRQKYGKKGENIVIEVPQGTVIRDAETKQLLFDMSQPDQTEVVLRGGKGGRGNVHFKSSTRQAPKFAEDGQKGKELWVTLELKTLADVGLVGFPNVGKSTLLSALTAAKPKIAGYHFTTLSPNLGIVRIDEDNSFVLADIPGLIEGASEGVGLGHAFLRHVERNRMLLHVVDVSGSEGRDPYDDYVKINNELQKFSPVLAAKPTIIVANKTDLILNPEGYENFKEKLKDKEIIEISALQQKGIKQLVYRVSQMLKDLPPVDVYEPEIEVDDLFEKVDKTQFEIIIKGDVYEVVGPAVDDIYSRVNFDDYQSMQYFHKRMREAGIIDALREAGINETHTVKIHELEFDFVD